MKKGYSIIARNFRCSYGEIDLIAYDEFNKILVFVEVKLRKKNALVPPLESITRKKISNIKKCALQFIKKARVNYSELRFDVISIINTHPPEIEHVEGAF